MRDMDRDETGLVGAVIAQVEALCAARGLRVARDVKLGPYLAPVAILARDTEGVARDAVIAIEPRGWSVAVASRMGKWAEAERERMRHLNEADFVAIVIAGDGQGPGGVTTIAELAAFLDGFSPPGDLSRQGTTFRSAPAPTRAYESEIAQRVSTYTGGSIVFVAMPFAESFAPVFFELIVPAAAGAGLVVMRTDQEPTLASIDERIHQGIRMADLVVADLTTYNPNVFYELGVAHALGKQSLLMRQPGVELPFDVRYHEAFEYPEKEPSIRLEALRDRLRAAAAAVWSVSPGGNTR